MAFLSGSIQSWLRRMRAPELDVGWVTPQLAVGAAPRSERLRQLARRGLSAALDLRIPAERDRDPGWDRAAERNRIEVLRLPTTDDETPSQEILSRGSAWLLARIGEDRAALVCCHVGSRRSATLATATLVRMGYALPEAFRLVARARAVANPSEAQLAALREFASRIDGPPDPESAPKANPETPGHE